MKNLGLLILRAVVGTFLAGHGAQKLFGWFNGPGLKGTHGFMEMLGMKPGKAWGTMAAVGEFSGGVLTILGFLNPLGPLNIASAMTVAIRRVHWKTPVWAADGGAELAATNLAAVSALALIGPGKYSIDGLFGIKLPRWTVALLYAGMGGITYVALQKPELVQPLLDRVMPTSASNDSPASDIEIENRPISVAMEQVANV